MTRTVNFEEALAIQGQLKFWSYNCADAAGTREIADRLLPRLPSAAQRTYAFERRCQNPAFAMMRRGIKVDERMRDKVLAQLEEDIEAELAVVDAMPIVRENWDGKEKETGLCPQSKRKDGRHSWEKWEKGASEDGRKCVACAASRFRPAPFNANSSPQVIHLLYDLLGIPPQRNKKGEISADEETLGRVAKKFPKTAELIGWEPDERAGIEGQGILYVRSLAKQRGEIAAPLENGRYMFSMNIGATWSGRSSSSKNPEGYGGNIQNKAQRQRPMFVADRGYELGNFDLCQAESLIVAYLAEDPGYIEAHLSGDVHTSNTRILYPDLPWTGDLKKDKKIASEGNPPWDPAPGHDWRFQAKRICLAPWAEVLTPDGWVRIEDTTDLSRIAVWHSNGTLTWELPLQWTREAFEGSLVAFRGRNLVQSVTSNHRMPYFNNGKLREKLAAEFPINYGRFPVHGRLIGSYGENNEPLARLIAATWSDGHHPNQGRTQQTTFTLRRERKIVRLRALLTEANLAWRETSKDEVVSFRVQAKLPKALSWAMLNWDLSSRLAFLSEVVHWDGDQKSRVFNADLEGLRIIQTMAHVSGMSGSIAPHGEPRSNEQQCWVLHLGVRAWGDWSHVPVESLPFSGVVHCPTVSTGWFLVREAGVISVSGNTHGYAYGLSPQGVAMHAKIPRKIAEEAHERLHEAYPGIRDTFQARVREIVRAQLPLVTPTGREIPLMGRPWDDQTFRQGYAAIPQSTVADVVWIACCLIHQDLDPDLVQLLQNGYDSILCQWPLGRREEAVAEIVKRMSIPMTIHGQTCMIPVEGAAGLNWGKANDDPKKGPLNPTGLKEVYRG